MNNKEKEKIENINENKINDCNKKIKNNEDEYLINIDKLNKKIEFLENELNILNKKELENQLRYRAEIENINRRNSIELEKAYKFSLENFMIELIIIIDNLERALTSDINKNNYLSIKDGVELTFKLLLNITKKFGLDLINEVNIPFDPLIHQAVIISTLKDYKPNYVINIMQKGYLLNGRLIRPAMVQVSSNLNEKDENLLT